MKKKKTITIFFMAVILLCIINLKRQHICINNELAFSNIEALASGENSGYYHCLGTGSLDCPKSFTKVAFIREI